MASVCTCYLLQEASCLRPELTYSCVSLRNTWFVMLLAADSYHHAMQMVVWTKHVPSAHCFVSKEEAFYHVHLCYCWSLFVRIIVFGPMSLH
jgi:hypothetical protein